MTPSDTAHPEGERELLPCPFCGCTDLQVSRNIIICRNWKCGAEGPDIGDWGGPDAVAKRVLCSVWNTRPAPPSRPQGEEGLREAEKAATEANRDLRSALWQTLYPKFFLNKKALAEALDVMLPVFNAYAAAQAVHAVFGRAAISNQGKPSS